ncbi:MAG: hypothetical protein IH870_08490 [Chloroflexi bacterium]|nr:hypothetical protein [Chloroflexota bacterium]
MSDVPTIRCPVCGVGLKAKTSISKKGKVSLSLACPRDPRDFRVFINDQAFVRRVLDSLEGFTPSPEGRAGVDDNPTPDNPSKRILERPNG